MYNKKQKNYFPGGLPGGRYKPLTDEEIIKIHKTAMGVFEKTGIEVNDDRALNAFHEAGANVDFKKRRVRASEEWILDKISTAPESVTLYGREEEHNLILDDYNVYFGTGGTATNVLDLVSGERRLSKLDDIQKSARIVDALDNIHYYVISCFPNELDKNDIDVNRFYASLKNTSKHVMGGVYTKEGIERVSECAAMIAGGKEKLLEKPFISFITAVMSPLVMDEHYTALMIAAVESGLPLAIPTAPMAGTTSPATLAGTLVQMIVEALSGVLLTQILNPGHPVLFGCVPATADLRTGAFCFGSIETGMMNAACAQISRFYKLPNYVTAGSNEAKTPDIQSGYESMASSLMCALSGCNYIHHAAGIIESGMVISYEQYVIDNEILGMCMRAVKGIEVTENTLAGDVINDVGPAGNYLVNNHTILNMKNEFFYGEVSDRQTRVAWEQSGEMNATERANIIAKDILENHNPSLIDKEIESKIIESIPGVVDIRAE
jgi:trimethylamine--corrinoid protein Co-methyltransferase